MTLRLQLCAKCHTACLPDEMVVTRLLDPSKDRAVCDDCYMDLELPGGAPA